MLTKINLEAPNYTRYEIEAGQQNFKPLDNIFPAFWPKGFEMAFWIDISCWYNWGDDKDRFDWNKLKGLTKATTANNKDSAMIAWRPSSEEGMFEVCAYTNDKNGKFIFSEVVNIEAGQLGYARCEFKGGEAAYYIEVGFTKMKFSHSFRKFWIMREVGTWIGGANNSPGPYGGEASQDMFMHVEFKRL